MKWWGGLKRKHETFLHGKGISHIIAKRDWEGKWIKEFQGQRGIDIAYKLVEVIAKGLPEMQKNGRINIEHRGYIATLSRPEKWEKKLKRDEEWLLSGFRIEREGYRFILESAVENGGKVNPPLNASPFQDPAYHSYFSATLWPSSAGGSRTPDDENLTHLENEVNLGWLYDL